MPIPVARDSFNARYDQVNSPVCQDECSGRMLLWFVTGNAAKDDRE